MTPTTGFGTWNSSSINEGDNLHIRVAELDGRRPAENLDAHFDQALRLVDAFDLPGERRERPRPDAHRVAQPERLRPAPSPRQTAADFSEFVRHHFPFLACACTAVMA